MSAVLAPPGPRRPAAPPARVVPPLRGGMVPKPEHLAARGLPPAGTRMTIGEFLDTDIPLLAEVVDGRLEYLPMPDRVHSEISIFFLDLFRDAARERGHNPQAVMPPFLLEVDSPFTVRGREPDLLMFLNRDDPRNEVRRWTTAGPRRRGGLRRGTGAGPRREAGRLRRRRGAGVLGSSTPRPPKPPPTPAGGPVTVRVLGDGAYRATVSEEGAAAASALLSGLTVPVSVALTGGRG